MRKTVLCLFVCMLMVLAGCQMETAPAAGPATIGFNYQLASVFSQTLTGGAKSIETKGPESYAGELVAENLDTGGSETVSWFAVVDEDTFSISSSKTAVFQPGNYNFYLTLSKGSRQYYGEALGQVLTDGQFSIPMTLKPVIGDTVSNIDLAQIAALRFSYPADEFAGIANPQLGYRLDGGDETILALSQGVNDTYINLLPGAHTIELKLYDGNKQVGRSISAQENVTVVLTENITMDIVPLHAEAAFNLSLQGGGAVFTLQIPDEIVAEAGNVTNLGVVLNMTSPVNGPREVSLPLTEVNGSVSASYTFSNFRYDTVNMALSFTDIETGDVLGAAVKEGVVLDVDGSIPLFNLELIRRAVIGGSLMSVLGVNVFDAGNLPASNVNIYINGEFKGITGNSTFGTAGYLKLYLPKGDYTVKGEINDTAAETNVTLSALGITSVDLILSSIPQGPQVVVFHDANLESAMRTAVSKPTGDIYDTDLEALTGLLNLGSKNIADISGLEHCTNVSTITLSYNHMTDLSSLSGLTNLISLNMMYTPVSDISPLSGLLNLGVLNIANCQVSDLSPVSGLTNLTSLYIYENQISSIDAVAGMTNLEVLEAQGNIISDLSSVENLVSLTSLRLGENNITDLGPVSGLTALDNLELGGNHISDISPISGLTALTNLRLSINDINDTTPLSGLVNLTKLYLDRNAVSDISSISGLTALTTLELFTNQISDPAPLSGLIGLDRLSLSGNQISDVSSLNGLTNLWTLNLDNNTISDISALSGLTALRTLGLSRNQISGVGAVSGMTALMNLYLNENQISDIIPLNGLIDLNLLHIYNNNMVIRDDGIGTQGKNNLDVVNNLTSNGVSVNWQTGNITE